MTVVVTPDGSNRIVVADADAAGYLARGYLADAEFQEQVQTKMEARHQAWLADPASLEERFARLREVRDQRLAATDYLLQTDYPLDPATRQAVIVYRQALRDLPAQANAPWDGGGAGTPWPVSPLA